MIKRLFLTMVASINIMMLFAIDPHGARVDGYGRGYTSSGDGVGGLFLVIAIVIGVIFLVGTISGSKNSKKKTFSNRSTSNYSQYDDFQERIRRREKEDKDFQTGCSWALWLCGGWFIIFLSNYIWHWIS